MGTLGNVVQSRPLLVVVGPELERATFIHVEATNPIFYMWMSGLDKRDLGGWSVRARV